MHAHNLHVKKEECVLHELQSFMRTSTKWMWLFRICTSGRQRRSCLGWFVICDESLSPSQLKVRVDEKAAVNMISICTTFTIQGPHSESLWVKDTSLTRNAPVLWCRWMFVCHLLQSFWFHMMKCFYERTIHKFHEIWWRHMIHLRWRCLSVTCWSAAIVIVSLPRRSSGRTLFVCVSSGMPF